MLKYEVWIGGQQPNPKSQNWQEKVELLSDSINRLLAQLTDSGRKLNQKDLERILSQKNFYLSLAIDYKNKNIAGMASIFISEKFSGLFGQIEDVVVDKNYRGQGIANELMNRLEIVAQSCGAKKIVLTSNPKRKEAHGLYKKRGFAKVKTNVFKKIL